MSSNSNQSSLFQFEREAENSAEKPYRDEAILRRLYVDEKQSTYDIADRLGCNKSTVLYWMQKHDIDRREGGRLPYASYYVDVNGYEQWSTRNGDSTTTVGVHRLLAIADGADPHRVFAEGTEVHHRAGDGLMNISGLLDVVSIGEHRRTHDEPEWTEQDGFPVLVSQTESGGDS